MGDGAAVRFDGTDGALDDVDMIVSSNGVKSDRKDVVLNATKLSVGFECIDL